MIYMQTPEVVLVASSPEILCRVADRDRDQPAAGRHEAAWFHAGAG